MSAGEPPAEPSSDPQPRAGEIEIAGRPETMERPEANEICIRIPLSGPPDDLLAAALEDSPQISSLCDKFEIIGSDLVVYPKKDGWDALGTMLTAVQALVAIANSERAANLMTDEQRRAEAAEARRLEVDAQLQDWWEQHG